MKMFSSTFSIDMTTLKIANFDFFFFPVHPRDSCHNIV